MNLKFKIYGEGRVPEQETKSHVVFYNNLNKRVDESQLITEGYNKTWIKIYNNDKLIFSTRIDLCAKTCRFTGYYTLMNDIDSLLYCYYRQVESKDPEECLEALKVVGELERSKLLLTAIQPLAIYNIVYKYTYRINGEIYKKVFSAKKFTEYDIENVIKNISLQKNISKEAIEIDETTHKILF